MAKKTKNPNSRSIEKSIRNEIVTSTLDLATDYAEFSLDSFLDNDAIKELPIVKTVIGVVKGGLKIREIFFVKKLLTFLKEFHSGKISEEVRSEFNSKLNTDTKYRNAAVEHLVILNERFLEIEKSKILANLFAAHINKKLDWELFQHLSISLEGLHIRGIQILKEAAESDSPFHFSIGDHTKVGGDGMLSSAGLTFTYNGAVKINIYGKYLYYYGVKGDIDFDLPDSKPW